MVQELDQGRNRVEVVQPADRKRSLSDHLGILERQTAPYTFEQAVVDARANNRGHACDLRHEDEAQILVAAQEVEEQVESSP